MRRAHRTLLGAALSSATLAFAGEASAETFRYTDRDGHVHEVVLDEPDAPAAAAQPDPQKDVVVATYDARAADGSFPYASIVRQACELYSMPPELVFAVIKVESGFNPRAVSRTGAMGLMQLMPQTATLLAVTNPFDPWQNIFGGVRYLRSLVNGFNGDVSLALAGYNAGAGAVRRAGKIPALPETTKYVASVLYFYHSFAQAPPVRTAQAVERTSP
jgi:soluble lytic murein transglycosylase-like protein